MDNVSYASLMLKFWYIYVKGNYILELKCGNRDYYVNAWQPWSQFIFWHEQLVSTFMCVCVRLSVSLLAGSICIKEKLHEFSAKQNILHRDRNLKEYLMLKKETLIDQTKYK